MFQTLTQRDDETSSKGATFPERCLYPDKMKRETMSGIVARGKSEPSQNYAAPEGYDASGVPLRPIDEGNWNMQEMHTTSGILIR